MTPAMIHHHPPDALLFDYASGALDAGRALLIATHLALCPICRAQVRGYEAMGGALLDSLAPVPVACAPEAVFTAPVSPPPCPAPAPAAAEQAVLFPEPLRRLVGADRLWRPAGPGIAQIPLSAAGTVHTRLLRIRGGGRVPAHHHDGSELTLVLAGGFQDGEAAFRRGDCAVCDADRSHAPVADPGEDCIALVVLDGRLRFTNVFERLVARLFWF